MGNILYRAGAAVATAPEDGVANDPAAQQAEQDDSNATTSAIIEDVEDVEGETVNPGLDEETATDNWSTPFRAGRSVNLRPGFFVPAPFAAGAVSLPPERGSREQSAPVTVWEKAPRR